MRVLLISNYQNGIGGINAQVDLLHVYLNNDESIVADIFSTKGNPLRRVWQIIKLLWHKLKPPIESKPKSIILM